MEKNSACQNTVCIYPLISEQINKTSLNGIEGLHFWKLVLLSSALFTLHIHNDILNWIKSFEQSSALYSTKPISPDSTKINLSSIMAPYHTGGHFQYEWSFLLTRGYFIISMGNQICHLGILID